MISDLLERAGQMSNEDILGELKKCTLGQLRSNEGELLTRRRELRMMFGHLHSSFIDPASPGNREHERLVRLTDLVKVAIARKTEYRKDESTVVGKQPEPSELTCDATGAPRGPADSSEQAAKQVPALTLVEDWKNIEIRFLSDERVEIGNGIERETWNYEELGFSDRRNGKPNKAWLTLRMLAQSNGVIGLATMAHRQRSKSEKRMQEIRKILRRHFRISNDPLPFVEGTGYQASFKISCAQSNEA